MNVRLIIQSINVRNANNICNVFLIDFSCSINCSKAHKEKCVPIVKEELKEEKNEEESQRPLNLDEDEDIILSKDELSVLKSNNKIMTMLRNKNLKKIIKEIDSSKYKKRTLERIQLDPDFKEFTTEILNTLGFIKGGVFTLNKK